MPTIGKAWSTEDECAFVDYMDKNSLLYNYRDALYKRNKWDSIDPKIVLIYVNTKLEKNLSEAPL